MRYWGFNAIHSILSSNAPITGRLYIPAFNTRVAKLAELARRHNISVLNSKDPAWRSGNGLHEGRYPLLVTDSVIVPHGTFRTMEHYLSVTRRERELVLLLDGITDVGNIASIIRGAYNFGVTCLVCSHRTSNNVPLLIHRSAGYYLRINVVESTNIAQAISSLQSHRFWVYGGDATGTALHSTAFDAPRCAVVIGDEHHGLRTRTKQLCDFLVAIPQRVECESLNVSVAAGIMLYEIDRQQLAASPHSK